MTDQENEQRRRLEQAALAAINKTNEEVIKLNKINQKKQQVMKPQLPRSQIFHTSIFST